MLQLGKVNLEAPKLGLCPLCLSVLCHRLCLRICLRLWLRLWLRLRLRLKQRPRRSSLRLARLLPQHGDCMEGNMGTPVYVRRRAVCLEWKSCTDMIYEWELRM